MATPTISEYTAHLRQDKVGMREYMRIAGVDTKESDTFTSLTEKVLNVAGAQRQVYVQPDEPQAKEGIWLQTEQLTDFDVVSDPAPFINEIFSSDTKSGYNPDASNSGSKVARYYVVNNVPYYLVFDQSSATRPNNSYRFYRYNKEDNSYTLLQSYSASEIIAAREQVSNSSYDLAITHGAVCIDDNQEYLYLVGGGNSTTVSADPTRKYVVRFGLKTHSISRVFTFAKPFFVIGGANAWQCNCVMCGTKIFVFGYNDTNSGAYGPTASTKIIDLAAGNGTEYNKSNGPIFYGGTVLKFSNELIVGFGGGAGNFNSGQGMTHVRLFSTLTETTRTICYLTNETNQRAICAVGSLVYFAEYNNATRNFGCVNLEDYTVRYINKGNNPSYSAISSSMPYYDKDLNCIMFGSFVGTKYPFVLTTKDYTRDTVVIFQASYETAAYKTNVFTTNNFKSDVKLGFSNAWLYKTGVGIDKTIKRYYGTGTEWKEMTESNAFGGIIDAPILQNKSIEITENGVTDVVADVPYDGLERVQVTVNVEGKEDLTEELTNYDTSLTAQSVTIQDIIRALVGKASGGSEYIPSDYVQDGLIAYFDARDDLVDGKWMSRIGEDYWFQTYPANGTRMAELKTDDAIVSDATFAIRNNVDYHINDYTIELVGKTPGGNTNFFCFDDNQSTHINIGRYGDGIFSPQYLSNGANYMEKVFDGLNNKRCTLVIHLRKTLPRTSNGGSPEIWYSVNGSDWYIWKGGNISSSGNYQSQFSTLLSYYSTSLSGIVPSGAEVSAVRVYNRRLTTTELADNHKLDKINFGVED